VNERIQELVKSVDGVIIHKMMTGRKQYVFLEDDFEKFVILIVKEMCDMMRHCQDDCDTGDASETNWGYISQLQDWIDRFEKHFGVKE
jgi:hypothetical protein